MPYKPLWTIFNSSGDLEAPLKAGAWRVIDDSPHGVSWGLTWLPHSVTLATHTHTHALQGASYLFLFFLSVNSPTCAIGALCMHACVCACVLVCCRVEGKITSTPRSPLAETGPRIAPPLPGGIYWLRWTDDTTVEFPTASSSSGGRDLQSPRCCCCCCCC